MADNIQDMEPARKRLKRGSYIHRTVGTLTIAAADDRTDTVESTLFTTNICESRVSWQLENGGQSTSLPNSEGYYGAAFFGSKLPFVIKKYTIQNVGSPWYLEHPDAGKTVFMIEPLPDPDNIFPLLGLPTELRFMIYRLVLEEEALVYVSGWRSTSNKDCIRQSLFLVNRQIRAESIPIYLSYNRFLFSDTRTGLAFIRALGPDARFLHSVGVKYTWFLNTGTELMRLLAGLPIRTITISGYLQLSKIARSAAKGWFPPHAPTELEIDSLTSLFKVKLFERWPQSGRSCCWAQCGKRFCEVENHYTESARGNLAKLIDDLVL